MIEVDCSEMTLDEQLALASTLTEGLSGRAIALVKDSEIVFVPLTRVGSGEVLAFVKSFVSKRKDAQHYSIEATNDEIVVHTPDPLARSRGRKDTGQLLPDNLLKCPFFGCGFVTPYQELYDIHVRSHGAF